MDRDTPSPRDGGSRCPEMARRQRDAGAGRFEVSAVLTKARDDQAVKTQNFGLDAIHLKLVQQP